MTDDERQKYLERYRHASDEHLRGMLAQANPDQRDLLNAILDDHRRAADAPEQQRFEKGYAQTERHHRASNLCAWIAAGISLVGAVAAWLPWFQPHSQPTIAPAPTMPAAVATPTKAPTERQ
jgi:hypothetical protein